MDNGDKLIKFLIQAGIGLAAIVLLLAVGCGLALGSLIAGVQ